MRVNTKELATGGIFIVIGAFFAITAFSTLAIGTAFRMGPGYFPLVLAGLLVLLGVFIAVQGVSAERTDFGIVPWRGLFFILAAPIFFGFTVEGLGLFPSLFLTCMLAAFASRQMTLKRAVLISLGLSVFCVGLFGYAIRLNIPIIGSWLGM